jgi:peptidoglycan/LPS O-acetylase OafA/YrhL
MTVPLVPGPTRGALPDPGAGGLHPHTPQLDALTAMRFLAAMMVVAFHYAAIFPVPAQGAGPVSGVASGFVSLGYSGVTFFFMLSVFILAYNYRDADFSQRQTRRHFYRARVARIFPVYLVTLAFALPFFLRILPGIHDRGLQFLFGSSLVLAPLGLQSWVPGAACAWNCPSWSISTEFFFYLVFPFVFPAIYRRPRRWAGIAIIGGAVAITLCSLLWDRIGHGLSVMATPAFDTGAELGSQFIKYFPVVRVPEFLLGIALFVGWERTNTRRFQSGLLAAAVLAGALLWLGRADISDLVIHDGLSAVVWAPLILFGANLRRGPLVWPVMIYPCDRTVADVLAR